MNVTDEPGEQPRGGGCGVLEGERGGAKGGAAEGVGQLGSHQPGQAAGPAKRG